MRLLRTLVAVAFSNAFSEYSRMVRETLSPSGKEVSWAAVPQLRKPLI
jgi:hypothetical protein